MELKSTGVLNSEQLLEHWQGHRNLTRKVILAFPEDKLFNYSVGGMRPMSDLALEMIGMAEPGIRGVLTGKWDTPDELAHHHRKRVPKTKQELLELWDKTTEEINTIWPQIKPERFHENDKAFGQWEGPIYFFLMYWIDNEIHHRGQAYVYLRSLGIDPPPFWERL